jgi:hypothetical protein
LITEPIVLCKEYLDLARTLLHLAGNTTDLTIADSLRELADDCVRRAAKPSQGDSKALVALIELHPARLTPA